MIGNSRFFILTIVFMCLLFLPLINCTKPDLKERTLARDIRRLPLRYQFDPLWRQDSLHLNSEDEGQLKEFLDKYLQTDQHRRALAFHAMRGKRLAKMT